MKKPQGNLVVAVSILLVAGTTVGVAAQGQPSVSTDILADVELVTETVEPGVLRVLSDGVRDLSIPLVADAQVDGTDRRANRIAVDPHGSVWIFGREAFFRLGAAASYQGRAWDTVDVDEQGTIWALLDGGDLESFAGGRWHRNATRVLDYDLHPDGSVFMFWEEPGGRIDFIGPLRKRDWKDGWNDARRSSKELGEGAIVVKPGHDGGGTDTYRGWLLQDGAVDGWSVSTSMGGSNGPLNDDGEVLSMASGPNGGSWFVLRFDGAAEVVDGRIVASAPDYWVARGTPESPGNGDSQWFEVQHMSDGEPAPVGDIEVAPDRSVWLPTNDGLAHFDRKTWAWYMRGHHIDDVAIAADGKAWVQAADGSTVSTYVIDPEVAMRAR